MVDEAPVLDLGTAAAAYARAGYEIFPLNPDKTPRTWNGMLDATSDPAQIEAWWRQWPRALIGCRIPEGVVLLDVDPRHRGGEVWKALKAEHGEIPMTRRHLSGRRDGGGHVWFQAPARRLSVAPLVAWAVERGLGHIIEGTELKPKYTAGIDLLHHGHRYTILPPSPHLETGHPYEWRGDEDTPILPMPPWLEQLVTEPDNPQVNSNGHDLLDQLNGHAATRSPAPSDPDSIADWYTSTSTWTGLLQPRGWTLVKGDGDTDGSLWRHPNASAKYSASVKHGCLFVHTPNTPFDETTPGNPNGYTRFHAYAELDHGGDASAAALAARELKDGPLVRVDLEGLIAPTADGAAAGPPAAWEPPLPLEGPPPPPYPLHTLPDWVAEHCNVVADRLQVPVDLCGQLALGVLASVAMGHLKVAVRPSWVEHVNLYLTTVMPSGSGKSPADRAIVGALRRFETELIGLHAKTCREAEIERQVAERRAKKALEAASKVDGDLVGALEAQAAADAVEVPSVPRLMVGDATPEVIPVLLERHGGRLAQVSTEAELYDIVLGTYGARVNIGPYLKAWSGDEIIIDRKGGSGSPGTEARIAEPLLTISITVQPAALEALRSKDELVGRGFVQRFCYAWPASLVGHRTWNAAGDSTIPTRPDWERRVLALGHRLHSWGVPAELRLSGPGLELFFAWRQELEDRLVVDDDSGLAEFVAKLTGSVARTAAILHIAEDRPIAEPVADDIVARAIELGNYWLAHADAVWLQFGTSGSFSDARTVLAWLRREKPTTFRQRDVFTGNRRKFDTSADAGAALATLAEHGWIRPSPAQKRRDSPVWEPHPEVLG